MGGESLERATIFVAIVAVVIAVFVLILCCALSLSCPRFSHLSRRILRLFGIPKSPKIGAGVMITFDKTETQ